MILRVLLQENVVSKQIQWDEEVYEKSTIAVALISRIIRKKHAKFTPFCYFLSSTTELLVQERRILDCSVMHISQLCLGVHVSFTSTTQHLS